MIRRLVVMLVTAAAVGGFGVIAPASAHCTVNTGTCDGGHCLVNTGTCNDGANCYVNAGTCTTAFVLPCEYEQECPIN